MQTRPCSNRAAGPDRRSLMLATALGTAFAASLAAAQPASPARQPALPAQSSQAVDESRPAAFALASIIEADRIDEAVAAGAILWDVRDTRSYEQAHLPGATSIGDINRLRDPNREDWIAPAEISRILGGAGIDVIDRPVVVYGFTGDASAYYVASGMKALGASRISVYHGGIDDWKARGRPLSQEATRLPPVTLALKPVPDLLIGNEDMIRRVRGDDTGRRPPQILDTRTPREFSGDDIRAIRGGHIPQAVNIPYERNWIDPDAALKLARREVNGRDGMALQPPESLRQLYAGLDPEQEVVVYCQSGVRASVTATILRDLGFKDVKVYEPSWLGYAGQLSAPAENEVYLNVGALNSRIGALQSRIGELESELARLKSGR